MKRYKYFFVNGDPTLIYEFEDVDRIREIEIYGEKFYNILKIKMHGGQMLELKKIFEDLKTIGFRNRNDYIGPQFNVSLNLIDYIEEGEGVYIFLNILNDR